jgi:asparaginyl-tRNA synthetase
MKSKFYIENANQFVGQKVTIEGWVYNKRSSGKVKFLVMRDGTGLMQGVLYLGNEPGQTSAKAFELFDKLTQESSIRVTGIIQKNDRQIGGFEMQVEELEIISLAHENYPISHKEHGVDFLMNHRHLWIRTPKQVATLRIRSTLIKHIRKFFDDRGFVCFDAPILTPSSCEGTSTLFSTEYFDEKAYLTQSGQLYGEVGAMALGRIYVFGPTFRAEKSKTRKHLTEFWMVEPEVAFNDLNDNMELGDEFITYLIQSVLKECQKELKTLERDISKLEKIKAPFPRIHYEEALKILEQKGVPIPWGEDFGAPQETAIGEAFDDLPVWIHHFPKDIKAFYFKKDDKDPRYALGCDLIAPHGYGEIIGGGQREEDYETLKQAILNHGLSLEDYNWYLDLRKYGSVPHSGFGLGLERTVSWICGLSHVRESIPFPRMINNLRP